MVYDIDLMRDNKLMKKRLNLGQAGFTLAEIMVAVGLLGVLSLAVMNQLELIGTSKKEANEAQIINNITDKLAVELSRQETCSDYFKGKLIDRPVIDKITDSHDKEDLIYVGMPIKAQTGSTTKNSSTADLVKVKSISSARVGATDEFILSVTFEKKSGIGALSVFKNAPVVELRLNFVPDLTVPTAPKILYCYNDISTSIKSAIRLSCQGNASKFIEPHDGFPNGKCVSNNLLQTACLPGEYITKIEVTIDGEMKGTCSTVAPPPDCPAGKVVDSFSDGKFSCKDPFPICLAGKLLAKDTTNQYVCIDSDSGCLDGYAIKKINTNGKVDCQPYYPPKWCATYVTSMTPGGNVECADGYVTAKKCDRNEFVSHFDPSGNPVCTRYIAFNQHCPAGQLVIGFNSAGLIICQAAARRLSCNGTYSPNLYTACTGAGGVVQNPGGSNSFCRLPGSSCGALTQCRSHAAIAASSSCTDLASGQGCSTNIKSRAAEALAFDNPVIPVNTPCYTWFHNSGVNMGCSQVDLRNNYSGYTPVTEIGCY